MEEIFDNGCSAHPDCFTCPFSVCRHEMAPGQLAREIKRIEARATNQKVEELMATGMTRGQAIEAVAESQGYTARTVFRHIEIVMKETA